MLIETPTRKLDAVGLDALLLAQNPLGLAPPTFDLRGVSLITPAAIVQLAALCQHSARASRMVRILADDSAVRRYLVRCGFVAVVSETAQIEPAIERVWSQRYGGRDGSNPMLIELNRIENGAALPKLLDRFVWVLRHRLKYGKRDAYDVTTAVSELSQNAFDHNAGMAGFVAMQVYGKGSRRFLEIAVSDFGDGFLTSLRRNPKNVGIRSDLEAIQRAMKLGVSEHDDPTRGTGLHHLLEITYRHQGAIQIKSGRSKVRYRMDRREGWAFPVRAVPGVHVALTLPSKVRS